MTIKKSRIEERIIVPKGKKQEKNKGYPNLFEIVKQSKGVLFLGLSTPSLDASLPGQLFN
jgi:hypothetical protein